MTDRPLRYPELSSTEHLRARGREFLGHRIYATEKRDGANIHLWAERLGAMEAMTIPKDDPDIYVLHYSDIAFHGDDSSKLESLYMKIHISSRNMDDASEDMKNMVKATPDLKSYIHMLAENPNFNIFVEFVPAGLGPTRIEPRHKVGRLVLFDIAVVGKEVPNYSFFPYTFLYQLAKHHKVPIVKLLGDGRFPTMEEYKSWIDEMLKYCKRHRREGVVVKCYDTEPQVYAKEKTDMPPRPKFSKTVEGGVVLPSLPDSEVNGAINKVFADFGREFILDKTKAMPKIAEYVNIEARKHMCVPPKNIYQYYLAAYRTYAGSEVDREIG